MTKPRASLAPWLLAAAGYAGLTLATTWPLARELSAVVPHDLGDPLLNTWILWWNAHAAPLSARWWDAPIFWPTRGALALSEHLVGLSPLSTPLQWLGAGPATTYNILFLLSFPLTALATHALAFHLTRRHDAAAVAALMFGFGPYRTAQLAHLQMLWTCGMATALLGLHRFVEEGRTRWLALAGASWLFEALTSSSYLVFLPVLLTAATFWFARGWRAWRPIAVTGIVASLPLAPILWTYSRVHAQLNLSRHINEIRAFSADLGAFVTASPLVGLWGWLASGPGSEQALFPGATVVVVVAAAAAAAWRGTRARVPDPFPRVRYGAAALACVFAAIALAAPLAGAHRLAIGGVTIVSVGSSNKPLTMAMWCLVVTLVFSGRWIAAWRERSPLVFYASAAGLMFVLSLGPEPQLAGQPLLYKPPYAWLMALPGFDAVRVPARFAMLGLLCVSMVAAIGFARLAVRLPTARASAAAAIAIAAVVADGWIRDLPLLPLPARFADRALPAGTAVLELPLGDVERDAAAMFRAIYHGRPVVNGYSGYLPRDYAVLRVALDGGDTGALDAVTSSGPTVAAIDERTDEGREWAARVARRAGALSLGAGDGRRFFLLPAIGRVSPPSGERLPIARASAGGDLDLRPLTDRNPATRWDSGRAQHGAEVVTIDLGAPRVVLAVSLGVGDYLGDFPRLLAIDSSIDGGAWVTRWKGPTSAEAIEGARLDARTVPLWFALEAPPARFVRLRQIGADRRWHWSIAELGVFGY